MPSLNHKATQHPSVPRSRDQSDQGFELLAIYGPGKYPYRFSQTIFGHVMLPQIKERMQTELDCTSLP